MKHCDDIDSIVEFGVDALREAGEIALKYFRTDLAVTNKAKKRSFDPVTAADREIEACIRRRIQQRFPGHGIIGEELGIVTGSEPLSWLIDPIDGTRSFVSGFPMWGILLGLMEEGKCVAGFMGQPLLGETYVGSTAGGYLLYRDGKRTPFAARNTVALEESILCCTHPNMFRTPGEKRVFEAVERRSRFSRLGTECCGYGLLALGFVDVIVEADLAAYDIVPLIPLVESAGGVVSNWQGGPATGGGAVVAAANPRLHAEVLELIRTVNHTGLSTRKGAGNSKDA